MMVKRFVGFLLGVALGVGLAVLIGWTLFPLNRQEVTPASMRGDYRAEYLRLTALAFQADGDLALAEARLRALDTDPFTAPVVTLAESWIAEGRSEELVSPLVNLAQAFEADTAAMAPYVVGGEP